MFIVIVRHFCKPDLLDKAVRRIDANGDRMSALPGFLFRHRAYSTSDSLEIGVITAWTDKAAYANWMRVKAAGPVEQGPLPYFDAVSVSYEVSRSHAPA